MLNLARIKSDLQYVFNYFPTASLEHVLANRHWLIRQHYEDGNGGGCLFRLLSEPLTADRQITKIAELTRFFTGASGPVAAELPEYQSARCLVRGDRRSELRPGAKTLRGRRRVSRLRLRHRLCGRRNRPSPTRGNGSQLPANAKATHGKRLRLTKGTILAAGPGNGARSCVRICHDPCIGN